MYGMDLMPCRSHFLQMLSCGLRLVVAADHDLIPLQICGYEASPDLKDVAKQIAETDQISVDIDPAGVVHQKLVIALTISV